MTTYAEQQKNIGKVVTVNLGGLHVKVTIVDFKTSYGRDRWQVTPVAGSGKVWLENIGE